jgi:hypothetical protein
MASTEVARATPVGLPFADREMSCLLSVCLTRNPLSSEKQMYVTPDTGEYFVAGETQKSGGGFRKAAFAFGGNGILKPDVPVLRMSKVIVNERFLKARSMECATIKQSASFAGVVPVPNRLLNFCTDPANICGLHTQIAVRK